MHVHVHVHVHVQLSNCQLCGLPVVDWHRFLAWLVESLLFVYCWFFNNFIVDFDVLDVSEWAGLL